MMSLLTTVETQNMKKTAGDCMFQKIHPKSFNVVYKAINRLVVNHI